MKYSPTDATPVILLHNFVALVHRMTESPCAAVHAAAATNCVIKHGFCTGFPFYKHSLMWANAQRDGHPVKYRWLPLFNAAVWLTPITRVQCSNAAKTRNPLKFAGVPQTRQQISAASGLKFTIL